jgi:hypothetical protein
MQDTSASLAAWARKALRPRTIGKHSRAYVPPAVVPRIVHAEAAPDEWSRCLDRSRLRRHRSAGLRRRIAYTSACVRPYVLTPTERRRVLSASLGAVCFGDWEMRR